MGEEPSTTEPSWSPHGAPHTGGGWGPTPIDQPTVHLAEPSAVLHHNPHAAPPPVLAGFWRRGFGLFFDGIALFVINLLANAVGWFVYFVLSQLSGAESNCQGSFGGAAVCADANGLAQAGAIAATVVTVLISVVGWWMVIPRRMSRYGASVGMSAVSLELVSADDLRTNVTTWRALVRCLVASALPLVTFSAAVLIVAGLVGLKLSLSDGFAWDGLEDLSPTALAALILVAFTAVYLPQLWMLVDRRRQTLYDKITSTAVVRRR